MQLEPELEKGGDGGRELMASQETGGAEVGQTRHRLMNLMVVFEA